ncbi:MAG TPA: DUF1264 domain-containing protein [Thermomicrobiales bacterium]|jgi:hypothetical protein
MRRLSIVGLCLLLLGLVGLLGIAPRLTDAHQHPSSGEAIATTEGKPFEGFTLHLDAKMHFPGDPAMIAHHYCKTVGGGMIECLIFDGEADDAHLVAAETIVSPEVYDGFDPAEQKLWHYHKTELPKVEATLPDLSPDEAATVVAAAEETYGKVYLLWDPSASDLPVGQPSVRIMQ